MHAQGPLGKPKRRCPGPVKKTIFASKVREYPIGGGVLSKIGPVAALRRPGTYGGEHSICENEVEESLCGIFANGLENHVDQNSVGANLTQDIGLKA